MPFLRFHPVSLLLDLVWSWYGEGTTQSVRFGYAYPALT